MENIELKTFLNKNHGYIATKDFETIGISKTLIPELLNKKVLRKVTYGLYIDNNLVEDEFYILQKRFSNIILSYNTAFYLLNLSDRAPYKIDVTTISHNNISENLNIHYVSKDKFDIGVGIIRGEESQKNKGIIIHYVDNKGVDYKKICEDIENYKLQEVQNYLSKDGILYKVVDFS